MRRAEWNMVKGSILPRFFDVMRNVSDFPSLLLRYIRYSGNNAFLIPLFLLIQHWIIPNPLGQGFIRKEHMYIGSSRFKLSIDVIRCRDKILSEGQLSACSDRPEALVKTWSDRLHPTTQKKQLYHPHVLHHYFRRSQHQMAGEMLTSTVDNRCCCLTCLEYIGHSLPYCKPSYGSDLFLKMDGDGGTFSFHYYCGIHFLDRIWDR
ncbi:hypothetical protein ACHAW5_006906 [Stephanodiscus triporus]|uniref:Uncharacterized protein n=1 Tax=Stephanodiscus triporus TaxID=2934178 RepID=A0ABD3NS11_9STRA